MISPHWYYWRRSKQSEWTPSSLSKRERERERERCLEYACGGDGEGGEYGLRQLQENREVPIFVSGALVAFSDICIACLVLSALSRESKGLSNRHIWFYFFVRLRIQYEVKLLCDNHYVCFSVYFSHVIWCY